MDDKTQFNNMFAVRLKECLSKEKDVEESTKLLENLKFDFEELYDINSNIISTNNPLEYIIDLILNSGNPKEMLNIMPHIMYHFLGLNYMFQNANADAINNFSKALKLNPYFFDSVKQICNCYIETKDFDKIPDTLKEYSGFIYTSEQLADYYCIYANYLFNKKLYSEANIMYSLSDSIKTTTYNQKMLTQIASIENRIVTRNTEKEINDYLEKHGIIKNISKDIIKALIEVYKKDVDSEMKAKIRSEAKTILYERTKSDIFSPTAFIKSELGFSINIPENWKVSTKSLINNSKGTLLYLIKPTLNDTINIINYGKVINNDLRNNYNEYRNIFLKQGLYILSEKLVVYNKNKFIQVFIEKTMLNESIVEVHNYIDVNDSCVDISSLIDMDDVNLKDLNSNEKMKKINILLASFKIYEDMKPKEEEFTFF